MERMTGYYNTFVVKIWCNKAQGTIRGYIQHASSQERIYFLNLEDMMHFIQSHIDTPPNDSVLQDKTESRQALLTEDFGKMS